MGRKEKLSNWVATAVAFLTGLAALLNSIGGFIQQ